MDCVCFFATYFVNITLAHGVYGVFTQDRLPPFRLGKLADEVVAAATLFTPSRLLEFPSGNRVSAFEASLSRSRVLQKRFHVVCDRTRETLLIRQNNTTNKTMCGENHVTLVVLIS